MFILDSGRMGVYFLRVCVCIVKGVVTALKEKCSLYV